MKETFEYLYTIKAEDSIEVEDVGNCCLKVLNDTGYEWFLIIDTKLGDCFIRTFGPFNVDIENHFIHGFKFDFSKIEYRESRLCNIIDKFINDPKKFVSQVFICEPEEAYELLEKINFREMS